MEATIRARVDEAEKLESESILNRLGLSMSEGIRLFIRQVNEVKGLPFEVKLTDKAAKEHDLWFREQVTSVLAKTDDPDRIAIPHDMVRAGLDTRIKALRTKAAKG